MGSINMKHVRFLVLAALLPMGAQALDFGKLNSFLSSVAMKAVEEEQIEINGKKLISQLKAAFDEKNSDLSQRKLSFQRKPASPLPVGLQESLPAWSLASMQFPLLALLNKKV
jgi:hypothetical protein